MAAKAKAKPSPDLEQLVAEADIGGRAAGGIPGKIIFAIAVAWSLWQLWYASPLPFEFGWGLLNDTEARPLPPAVGLLIAFQCFTLVRTQRNPTPA